MAGATTFSASELAACRQLLRTAVLQRANIFKEKIAQAGQDAQDAWKRFISGTDYGNHAMWLQLFKVLRPFHWLFTDREVFLGLCSTVCAIGASTSDRSAFVFCVWFPFGVAKCTW